MLNSPANFCAKFKKEKNFFSFNLFVLKLIRAFYKAPYNKSVIFTLNN